ncbi:MAG: Segregation and condensation protein B [Firmicutes bacterium ADurb.Bin182]|nr:MAG: Segregation and condensation protein B [Firmicutes bacterium ADurb.Bin182]
MNEPELLNNRKKAMGIIESILFVSGDPVPIIQLQDILGFTEIEIMALLQDMEAEYKGENRGIRLYVTDLAAQITSKPEYSQYVEKALVPSQTKTFSQAMLETLSIIAYKQPVTRSDIEAIRGVRCDYTVSQLQKIGLIQELGRKDCVGRPMLFGTTDAFLRQFGFRSISDLPNYEQIIKDVSNSGDLAV